MAHVEINKYGTKYYVNDNGQTHRDDGPAFITRNGTKIWYRDGEVDNPNGPASFNYRGIYGWNTSSERYRIGGPTWDHPNGYKLWFDKEGRIWPKL